MVPSPRATCSRTQTTSRAFKECEGVREPLQCCRRKDKPKECKGGFPLEDRLCPEAVVVCPGFAKEHGMPQGGRRNEVGSLYGPRNDPNLNGTHPALCAACGFNTDVQLPYRLPIIPETHPADCPHNCSAKVNEIDIVYGAGCTGRIRV